MYKGIVCGRTIKMTNKFYEQLMDYIDPEKLETDCRGYYYVPVEATFCMDREHDCNGCPLNFDGDWVNCGQLIVDILGERAYCYDKIIKVSSGLEFEVSRRSIALKYLTKLNAAFSGLKKVKK